MPGSAMFLIEGQRGAVLHTGDMRAEEHFIRALLVQTQLCRLSLRHPHIPTSPSVGKGDQFLHDSCSSDVQQNNF
jgi:hypothetical protein